MNISNNKVFTQVIVLIVLAIIIAAARSYVAQGVHGLLAVHDWLTSWFSYVFSDGALGSFIKLCLSFIVLPFFIVGILAIIYAIVKKSFMPQFMLIVWAVWLVMATALVMR